MFRDLLRIIFSPFIKLAKYISIPFLAIAWVLCWTLAILTFPIALLIMLITYLPFSLIKIHLSKVDNDEK